VAGTRRKTRARIFEEHSRRGLERFFESPMSTSEFNEPKPIIRGTGKTNLRYYERRSGLEERRGNPDNRKRQLGVKTTVGTRPAFEITHEEFHRMPKPGRPKVLSSTKETKLLKDRRTKDRRK
jgi:hypothetical protein